jgi:uncharacterized protein with GYD domain
MPTYISLLRLTQQGIQSIKQAPGRIDAARKGFEAVGAKLKEVYAVTGQYDYVAIMEAPDEATAARAGLALGAQGNVRSETMRAFTVEEFRNILQSLP